MRIKPIIAAVGLLLACTACGTSDNPSAKPSDKASVEPSTASPSAKAYTYQDCVDLLEYDYKEGTPQDASTDPECAHLTSDEYAKAVGEVLAAHKDDFIEQGERQVVWDNAWKNLSADSRASVCAQIESDGAEAVGERLKTAGAKPAGHEVEMAEYYRDNKC
ncbi:hypothetical protein ACWENA_08245 [Streptomyces sp. NPDC004779]